MLNCTFVSNNATEPSAIQFLGKKQALGLYDKFGKQIIFSLFKYFATYNLFTQSKNKSYLGIAITLLVSIFLDLKTLIVPVVLQFLDDICRSLKTENIPN
ncbi:hypothetical protein J6P11_01965 [bacterium]|nr:hypothetical protein [bacterium]